ncbi:MAG: pyrimidine-nucleoside phosphorylase [Eubacteriales bacterium]|nr:pyrimidine-nucleoside phosphorylase [Eubacteriales bacterium]MDD3200312.1 pyrimidine-nucleoside phosphorylase [Eubacteriales bacterium]
MNMYDIIYKKREGGVLDKEEIEFFIKGYSNGSIPDYQAAALLMAIFLKKMNRTETYELTKAMKESGDVVDLSAIRGVKVDKHSTGGVGDKTTLIVGPLAASCGVHVAKMSGRGLGFTGGTVDKMESIPGFRTVLKSEEFISLVNKTGLSVIGQTAHIAPADKKLYALRDVTATVDDLSLITSSIMSKKLASGSDAIVLDVKWGNGAFMKSFEDASRLGELMVEIGKNDGKKTIAVITDMSQPLGYAVGNSLEVIEAIETLKGNGPQDITDLSLTLASYMIFAGERSVSPEEGYQKAKHALESGAALSKFAEFIEGQGGDPKVINDYTLFPQPSYSSEIYAKEAGFIGSTDAMTIGLASQHSGAGRATKEDIIDLSAGIMINKKVCDKVEVGELLATVYGNDRERVKKGSLEAIAAFHIQSNKPEYVPLVKRVIQ